ncbi:hypothetical protein [Halomarina rubra]|uniref:Uncharacterized protein n=1 Tax=Halomarina rubra TaxID=2071873 RepID=A0ABD6ASC3_9EURY|nr:hypothetical protein [Halomarina rubra]
MAERVTIDLLDESGRPRSQFIDANSAIEARKLAVTRAWIRGVITGAVGVSTVLALVRWLGDEE